MRRVYDSIATPTIDAYLPATSAKRILINSLPKSISEVNVKMSEPLNILIIGCGIAGSSLATFLLLSPLPAAQKPRITILERTPKIINRGQNIDVRGKGVTIIRKLGIEQLIRSAHTGEEGVVHVDANDKPWIAVPAGNSEKEMAPTAEIEILRGKLAEICWKRSQFVSERVQKEGGAGIEYLFGDDVSEIEQLGDQVSVKFKKNPARSFDVVAGADGLQSKTRKLIWGYESDEERLLKLGMYGGFFSIPREETDTNWRRWFHATRRRGIMVRPDGTGERTTVFMHAINDNDPRLLEVAGHGPEVVEAQKRLLEEYFKGEGWETERIIREMWKTKDFYYDMIGQVKMDKFSKGRVVLVGDAG